MRLVWSMTGAEPGRGGRRPPGSGGRAAGGAAGRSARTGVEPQVDGGRLGLVVAGRPASGSGRAAVAPGHRAVAAAEAGPRPGRSARPRSGAPGCSRRRAGRWPRPPAGRRRTAAPRTGWSRSRSAGQWRSTKSLRRAITRVAATARPSAGAELIAHARRGSRSRRGRPAPANLPRRLRTWLSMVRSVTAKPGPCRRSMMASRVKTLRRRGGQGAQDGELGDGQRHLASPPQRARQPSGSRLSRPWAMAAPAVRGAPAAVPAMRRRMAPDAGHHLARAERLDHIVVGAQLDAQHPVDLVVARGQEQDRQVALGADAAADLQPVHARHVDVEHHQVGRRARRPSPAPPRRPPPRAWRSPPCRRRRPAAGGCAGRRRRSGWSGSLGAACWADAEEGSTAPPGAGDGEAKPFARIW